MAKYFLKLSGSNNITNVIEWDGISPYTTPPGYVIELATTTASINYVPSASNYEEPIFGGKLFGEFSGILTGSILINGQTIDELIHQTAYGTVTLYSSSMKDIDVKSGSFKISGSNLYMPFQPNTDFVFGNFFNYSSSFAKIINNDIENYFLTLKNVKNKNIFSKMLISNTELTSSISGSVSSSFYKLKINENNNTNNLEIFNYLDYHYTDWYVDINLSKNITDELVDKSTKYGKLMYNSHSNDTDPGSGYFSINSSTVWSEATELYVSLDNYEKNIEISSSKSALYQSTLNNIFYDKIVGSKIKLESDVIGDNTYKIFQITDMSYITGSGNNYVKFKVVEKSSHTDGLVLLAIGQKFNIDFELISNKKRQIDIVTGSKSYHTPYWAKDVIVMAIGAGGGGGGGIDAKSNHHFAIGGAGGSGGSISYSKFTELSGSIRIDCFVGNGGIGGVTGSGNNPESNNFLCVTCSFDYTLPLYEQFNIVDTIPPILSQSNATIFDILDDIIPTGSSGMSGESTNAYIYNSNFITGQSSLLGKVSAPGGVGGSGGYSLGITGSFSSSLVYDLIVSNSLYPVSIPGGTNVNLEQSIGEQTFYGGPGGHGITLNISENNIYENYAPSLPWGTGIEKISTPEILVLPFGKNILSSRRNDNNIDTISILIKRNYLSNNSGILIPTFPVGLNYVELSYDKPSDIAPTGGGGGTGWINSNLVSTSSIMLGYAGELNAKNSIFEYPISIGGNGGNCSTLGNLQVILPQSGSGPGAGGGGGSSDESNGNPQNGANGGSGAVVIISMG